jgi:Flp pilus assembly protein TadD
MRWISLLVVCAAVLLGGCASTKATGAHVLSGEAPVDRIISRGNQAAVEGDYLAASILYRQALSQAPSADVWHRLGVALTRDNDVGQAMWAFRNALELDPDHADSLQKIGLYLTAKDRAEEARPYLERLLALQPDNWHGHNALGVLADLEGHYDRAAAHYASAIEIHPEQPMLWNNLGFSYYLAGDYAGALRTMGKALQLDPGYAAARHNVALVLARQSRYDDALRMMKTAREEAQAYSDVGYLAYKMGDYAQAEELLTQAIQRSGTYNRQAHRNLAAVREARAATASGR